MAYYEEEESGLSGFGWLLTGMVIGGVLGVLFAPSAGEELRGRLGGYARDTGERAKGLASRIGDKIPTRVKVAAGFGALKEGARETFREARENIQERLS